MRRSSSLLFGLGLLIAIGCGSTASRNGFGTSDQTQDPSNPGDDGGSNSSGGFGMGSSPGLTLTPKNATIIIDTAKNPTVPGTQAFTVSDNGTDVTGASSFVITDTSLGSFGGATFTSVASLPAGTLGMSSNVTAKSASGDAVGSLTVVALRETGDSRDFFFTVPYQEAPTPAKDVLKFSTNIKQADVAFSLDTTGSMAGSINSLKSSLQTGLLAQLQTAIPNVGLAIVDFKDFNAIYDEAEPWAVNVLQTVTTNVTLAQNAVGTMSASHGGDGPEADVASMQFILDGKANSGGTPAIAAHASSAPGTYGGVDFRPGSVPIIVNITDIDWHDPSGSATYANLVTSFNSVKAKFVGVVVGSERTQADALSDATGSNVPASAFTTCGAGKCCTGQAGAAETPAGPGGSCRLNFTASAGTGLGSSIVQAIQAIAVGSTFDIKPTLANDPKNAGGVDATKFIKSLRAMDEGDATNGCPAAAAKDSDGDGIKDTFLAVKAGTPVCFEVIPNVNTTVPPTSQPQFFNAIITLEGLPQNLLLDTRSVLFLVPPTAGGVK